MTVYDPIDMLKGEGAWQTGPRGGIRRRVGNKWEYKGKGGDKPRLASHKKRGALEEGEEHFTDIPEYKLRVRGHSHEEIASKLKAGIDKAADLCKTDPPVCAGNLGIVRDWMPQFDTDNHPDVIQKFVDEFESEGKNVSDTTMSVGQLKATQREIKTKKSYGMALARKMYEESQEKGEGGYYESEFGGKKVRSNWQPGGAPIVVSRDGYVLDGHHRYAAMVIADPNFKMPVRRIDASIEEILDKTQDWFEKGKGIMKADFGGREITPEEQKNETPPWRKAQKSMGLDPIDLLKAGGWSVGPRGGIRRKVGSGWKYKGEDKPHKGSKRISALDAANLPRGSRHLSRALLLEWGGMYGGSPRATKKLLATVLEKRKGLTQRSFSEVHNLLVDGMHDGRPVPKGARKHMQTPSPTLLAMRGAAALRWDAEGAREKQEDWTFADAVRRGMESFLNDRESVEEEFHVNGMRAPWDIADDSDERDEHEARRSTRGGGVYTGPEYEASGGDKPFEDMSDAERDAFADQTVGRKKVRKSMEDPIDELLKAVGRMRGRIVGPSDAAPPTMTGRQRHSGTRGADWGPESAYRAIPENPTAQAHRSPHRNPRKKRQAASYPRTRTAGGKRLMSGRMQGKQSGVEGARRNIREWSQQARGPRRTGAGHQEPSPHRNPRKKRQTASYPRARTAGGKRLMSGGMTGYQSGVRRASRVGREMGRSLAPRSRGEGGERSPHYNPPKKRQRMTHAGTTRPPKTMSGYYEED